MSNIKEKISRVFNFSNKEIKGLAVLLLILLGLIVFFFVQKKLIKKEAVPHQKKQQYLDSLAEVTLKQSLSDSSNKIDPNELSYFQWMDLGISSELANTILRQKRKHKQFNCLDEIKAIPGVDTSSMVNYYQLFSIEEHCVVVQQRIELFEINSVSKKELASIEGIPHKIASRIVNYRHKLGGYYSITQLQEVHKLTDEEYRLLKSRLKVDASKIQKIKINTAHHHELKSHPYLTSKQASTIINFRKKITRYNDLAQFKKVYGLTAADVKKIKPYLVFD